MRQFNSFLKNAIKILPILILGLTPLIWFYKKWSFLLDGVDINFPLDPMLWFGRRFFVWNPIPNGGIDFSSSTAGLFFHLLQVIPYVVGLNLHWVQIISLVFWFMTIILMALFFARVVFPKKLLLQLLFVTLYSFNIYMFNTWENIKVANLSLVSSIPAVLTILLLMNDNRIDRMTGIFLSALVGILASGSGINPSYFMTLFVILFIFVISMSLVNFNWQSIKSLWGNCLIISSIVLLVNMFWILPTLSFIKLNISPAYSINRLGFVNWVDSLSENTGLVNVFRLQGAWDWYAVDAVSGSPLYIPYANNYFHNLPFLLFSFLLPVLAFLSFILVDKINRNLYIAFGLMLVIGLFLGTGTHLPTGDFFRWLMLHLPFFTLFRSPWYIFTPLVTLAYAGLITILFYNLFNRKIMFKGFSLDMIWNLLVIILIIGNLIYSYPLVTGKIFRPDRIDKFYIQFPKYVFEAKKWLDQSPDGRIIHYPDDELEKFNWGYIGIESILNLLTDKETLFTPLNSPDSPIATIIREFYSNLKKGHNESVKALADKLNVSLIFEKKDQPSLSPDLKKEIQVEYLANFGPWYFYQFPDKNPLPKIFPASSFKFGYPYQKGGKLMTILDQKDILVDTSDNMINKIPAIQNSSEKVILTNNSQEDDFLSWSAEPSKLSNRLLSKDFSSVEFTFNILRENLYQLILERYSLEDFGIDLAKKLEVILDGKVISLEPEKLTNSYVYYKPINFSRGEHKLSLKLQNKNLISNNNLDNLANFDKKGSGKFTIEELAGEKYLHILNKGQTDSSAVFSLSSFDPMAKYYVELKYKQVYGNNAAVLIEQATKDTLVKASTERLPNYPEWNVFSFYYEPVKTDSYLQVELLAPVTKDPLGTKVLYRDLKVFKIFTNNLFAKEVLPAKISSLKLDFKRNLPTEYQGTVEGGEEHHTIVFSENYSPKWEFEAFDKNGSPLFLKNVHFSANLYANAWYIEGAPKFYKFKIQYQSQKLYWIGFFLMGGTLFGAVMLLLKTKNK